MNNNLEEVMRRTYRYYYEDGLVEIAVGGLFALIGLVILWYQQAQANPTLVVAGAIGMMVVVGGGVFAVRWIVHGLKDRITAPRTGVVSHDHKPSPWRWWIIGGAFALVLIAILLPEEFSSIAVMQGGLLTIILVSIGVRVSMRRLQVVALLPLVVGLLSAYLGWGELVGGGLVFVVTGAVMALLGAVVFIRYMRDNPVQSEEE